MVAEDGGETLEAAERADVVSLIRGRFHETFSPWPIIPADSIMDCHS